MKSWPLIALAVAGTAIVIANAKSASASTGAPRVPAGWEPPADATVVSVPSNTLGFPVRGASWKANGQEVVLWWDPTDPETFLAMQLGTAPNGNKVPAVLAMGATPNSTKLAELMKQIAF